MKIKKTFRIDENLISELQLYADNKNITLTEAVESAIRAAIRLPDTCQTQSHTEESPENKKPDLTIQALIDQLAIKDKQIAENIETIRDLNSNLSKALDSTSQAHVLHAADKKEDLLLESKEQKQKIERLEQNLKYNEQEKEDFKNRIKELEKKNEELEEKTKKKPWQFWK